MFFWRSKYFIKKLRCCFERCADKIHHDDKDMLNRLQNGLINYFLEIDASPEYQRFLHSLVAFLFLPHDDEHRRIKAVQSQMNYK